MHAVNQTATLTTGFFSIALPAGNHIVDLHLSAEHRRERNTMTNGKHKSKVNAESSNLTGNVVKKNS